VIGDPSTYKECDWIGWNWLLAIKFVHDIIDYIIENRKICKISQPSQW